MHIHYKTPSPLNRRLQNISRTRAPRSAYKELKNVQPLIFKRTRSTVPTTAILAQDLLQTRQASPVRIMASSSHRAPLGRPESATHPIFLELHQPLAVLGVVERQKVVRPPNEHHARVAIGPQVLQALVLGVFHRNLRIRVYRCSLL